MSKNYSAPKQTKFKRIERGEQHKVHTIGLGNKTVAPGSQLKAEFHNNGTGLGRTPDGRIAAKGLGDVCNLIKQSVQCPLYNMQSTEEVRIGLGGPVTDATIAQVFGPKIDPFNIAENQAGIDEVETTMPQQGELNTNMIVCGVGFQFEPDNQCFTALGNSWTKPTGSVQAKPMSPNNFTKNDVVNGALGAAFAGATPTQTIRPAIMEHGWWAQKAMWHMALGYNLRWKIGQNTNIFDEVLRNFACTPKDAIMGSASSSEVDLDYLVRFMNERYESFLGSAEIFLKIDALRLGSVTSNYNNVGIFRPDRSYEKVGVTYGGGDISSLLKDNNGFRKLSLPYMLAAGLPIGLFAQENSLLQGNQMRAWLSDSFGFANYVPSLFTDDELISNGFGQTGAGVVSLEQTLDIPPVNTPQQWYNERLQYKSGWFKFTLDLRGFELTKDAFDNICSDPDVRNLVLAECGMCYAARGS